MYYITIASIEESRECQLKLFKQGRHWSDHSTTVFTPSEEISYLMVEGDRFYYGIEGDPMKIALPIISGEDFINDKPLTVSLDDLERAYGLPLEIELNV